jgi:hypothetical protein
MRLPNTSNLETFVKRANAGNAPGISISRLEAQGISREYINLVNYVMKLQDRIIELEEQQNNPDTLEIVTPNF